MENIITPEEFAVFRDISVKRDDKKINESISLAQRSDLYDILGDFYFDVYKNRDEVPYDDLMNGSEFEYLGFEYTHDGIKALLADFTYSRHIYMINVNLTPFGAQSKFTDDSAGVEKGTIRDLSKQAQVDAGIKFKTIQKYILSNPNGIFDRYCKGQNVSSAFSTIKLTKI